MKYKFKIGDWLFHEFELKQLIKENEVSDGSFSTYGSISDFCRPLSLRNNVISNIFKGEYDDLYNDTKKININWPDIHNWIERKWIDACDTDSNDKLQQIYTELHEFCNNIRTSAKNLKSIQVNGIRVMR